MKSLIAALAALALAAPAQAARPAAFAHAFMRIYNTYAQIHGRALIVHMRCRADGEALFVCSYESEQAGRYACFGGAIFGADLHVWNGGRRMGTCSAA